MSERYTFGAFSLDVRERRLSRDGQDIALAPKTLDVLVQLVRRSGRLVTKRELLDAVWPDAFVEEGIVAVHVSSLRKALSDESTSPPIQTVARTGYRFTAGVSPASSGATGARPVLALPPQPARPEVHELVGRGRMHLLAARRSEVPAAIAAFTEAIDADPTYAPAHAGLALSYCAESRTRLAPPREAYERARGAALRALAMDDHSADAQVALGDVLFLSDWNWVGAERSLQRALEINPNHTEAYIVYGHLLESVGRLAEGLAMKLRALERDPQSPFVHVAISHAYWNQRRYDDSILWANKALELDPTHLLAREHLAGAYWRLGDFDRHMTENMRHAEAFGVPASALEPVKRAYQAGGRVGVVRLALDEAAARHTNLPDVQLALFHAELGELDVALLCLERAIDGRDPCLVDLAVAPQWDLLRPHPRFSECLTRMGLPTLTMTEPSSSRCP